MKHTDIRFAFPVPGPFTTRQGPPVVDVGVVGVVLVFAIVLTLLGLTLAIKVEIRIEIYYSPSVKSIQLTDTPIII